MAVKEMTTKERFAWMYAHQEADRVPIVDSPWQPLEIWQVQRCQGHLPRAQALR
jgi:hypothetical protein